MVDEIIEDEIILEEDLIIEEELEESELVSEESSAEIERQRRLKFEQDLKDRFHSLFERNSACHQSGISNPDLYFDQQILYNKSETEALINMEKIESMDKVIKLQRESSEYLDKRKAEYIKIDVLLLEALAEKEAGNPAKMEEYLSKREAIKLANPKPIVE